MGGSFDLRRSSTTLRAICSLLCDFLLQNANDDVHVIPLLLDRILELVGVRSNVLDFIVVELKCLHTGLPFRSGIHRNGTIKGDIPSSHSSQFRCLL